MNATNKNSDSSTGKKSSNEIWEQILDYMDVLDEYEEMVESFKTWENVYDDVDDDEEDEDDSDLKDPDEEGISNEERRDRRWAKRKRKKEKILKKTMAIITKSMRTMELIVENIQKLLEFINKLLDIQNYIVKIQEFLVNLTTDILNHPYIIIFKRKIQIFVHKIKKLLVKFKKWLNKVKIKLIELFINGKMCKFMEAAYGFMMIPIVAVAKAIVWVLNILEKILNFLPQLLLVGPEGIAFFITPKTIVKPTQMPIVNMRKSIGDYMLDTVQEAINALLNTPAISNYTSKSAYVAQKVAKAQASMSAAAKGISLPDLFVPDPTQVIYKAIDLILALLPMPQPLPKYEKLNMFTNLGFTLWLITGWCRAGQVAFGMPGQLPGVPSAYAETTEL